MDRPISIMVRPTHFDSEPDSDERLIVIIVALPSIDGYLPDSPMPEEMDFLTHPFLGPPARRWRTEEKTRPILSWLLDMPGWVDSATAKYCGDAFNPPFSARGGFILAKGLTEPSGPAAAYPDSRRLRSTRIKSTRGLRQI